MFLLQLVGVIVFLIHCLMPWNIILSIKLLAVDYSLNGLLFPSVFTSIVSLVYHYSATSEGEPSSISSCQFDHAFVLVKQPSNSPTNSKERPFQTFGGLALPFSTQVQTLGETITMKSIRQLYRFFNQRIEKVSHSYTFQDVFA